MTKISKVLAVVALGFGLAAADGAFAAPKAGGGGGGGGGPHIGGGGGPRMGGGPGPRMGGGPGPRIGGAPRAFRGGPGPRMYSPNIGKPGWAGSKRPPGGWDGGKHRPPGGWAGGGKPRPPGGWRHHRRGYGGFYSLPLYDDWDTGYYYGSDCSYYWRRWSATGNPIWRSRYYDCID